MRRRMHFHQLLRWCLTSPTSKPEQIRHPGPTAPFSPARMEAWPWPCRINLTAAPISSSPGRGDKLSVQLTPPAADSGSLGGRPMFFPAAAPMTAQEVARGLTRHLAIGHLQPARACCRSPSDQWLQGSTAGPNRSQRWPRAFAPTRPRARFEMSQGSLLTGAPHSLRPLLAWDGSVKASDHRQFCGAAPNTELGPRPFSPGIKTASLKDHRAKAPERPA